VRRSSYLSRIARVGPKIEPALAPARVLFRSPSPIPDVIRVEAPVPPKMTPVETSLRREPGERIGHITVPSEGPAPTRASRAAISPEPPAARLTRPPSAQSSPEAAPRRESRPPTQLSGPVSLPDPPRLLSTKPALGEPEKLEAHFGETIKQGPLVKTGGQSIAPAKLAKSVEGALKNELADRTEAPPPSPQKASSAPHGTLGQAGFRASPVSQRTLGASRTILIPPQPVRRESLADTQGGPEKRTAVPKDAGTAVHIGTLEVRIVPHAPVVERHPARAGYARGHRA